LQQTALSTGFASTPYEPIGTIANCDEWKASAYERARYAIHLVITAASIALTEPVPVTWIGERRDRKGAEHGRGQNQLFQFRLLTLSHFRPDKNLYGAKPAMSTSEDYLGCRLLALKAFGF
jgi:hypothetical protein